MKLPLDGLGREELVQLCEMSYNRLTQIANGVGGYYREQERWLGGKYREIDVPAGPLKTFQARLQGRVFRHHTYYPTVYGCKGRGALKAAKVHAGQSHILHLDISSFFPSVRPHQVRSALAREGMDPDITGLVTRLTTFKNRLPQGCPTSTALGDLVLNKLDRRLDGLSKRYGFSYTRYVDDIVVSGNGKLANFEGMIRKIIEDRRSGGWKLNKKGGLRGPDQRHPVLGLVVNLKPNIPADYFLSLRHLLRQILNAGGSIEERLMRSLEGKVNHVEQINQERGKTLRGLLDQIEVAE